VPFCVLPNRQPARSPRAADHIRRGRGRSVPSPMGRALRDRRSVPDQLRRAFQLMRSGRPGPGVWGCRSTSPRGVRRRMFGVSPPRRNRSSADQRDCRAGGGDADAGRTSAHPGRPGGCVCGGRDGRASRVRRGGGTTPVAFNVLLRRQEPRTGPPVVRSGGWTANSHGLARSCPMPK